MLTRHFPCQNRGPGSDFLDPRPGPPDPPGCAPDKLPSHRCWSGKPGDHLLETPFWQGFCLTSGHTPWAPPAQTECAELLR
eukprot:1144105-Pelagomonas_calceolata.AAC.4